MSSEDFTWHDDVMHAFSEACNCLDDWEYGGADTREQFDRQKKAAEFVRKKIQAMAKRYDMKNAHGD